MLATIKQDLTQMELQAMNSIFKAITADLNMDADNLPQNAQSLIAEFVVLPLDEQEAIAVDIDSQLAIYQAVAAEHDDQIAEYVVESLHGADISDAWTMLLSDEQAANVPQVFSEWAVGNSYLMGMRVQYNHGLYKCIQNHTAQIGFEPDVAVSLWTVILPGQDDDDWAEWVQPESTNPYMIGDKVTHNNKRWVSIIDYNVFEPGVAGWNEWNE